MTPMDDLLKLWPAAAGGLVVFVASWGIGRFNNALAVTPSTRRQRVEDSSEDDLVLELALKKAPPTRMRLRDCDVTLTLGASDQAEGPKDDEQTKPLDDLAVSLSQALTSAMKTVGGNGMILVASDEVRFEAHCRVPRTAVIAIKVLLHGEQLLFEGLLRAKPTWTASVVSLPVKSEAPRSSSSS